MTETVKIDNPCYHCYTGAIGECYSVGCKYAGRLWSGDLWEDYKIEVEKDLWEDYKIEVEKQENI